MSAYLQITVLILHQDLYKCLNPDCYFMTTITNVSPTAKQSSVIHPFCRRILTVREVACSQGFPDHFVFYAIEDSVILPIIGRKTFVDSSLTGKA
ncbi:hypothetical protein BDP27DRAFT_1230519 [Rhodocollybia butyracea]|uniref:Uncharacterized protein n=1 Tax=Rhodocollybia butyracea TaxID=206335 RepID=A0A9P5U281_9AGAR|nr:hypothetical protein BDP27DRAFT_1230519 [Rhodocollybia butyracea]